MQLPPLSPSDAFIVSIPDGPPPSVDHKFSTHTEVVLKYTQLAQYHLKKGELETAQAALDTALEGLDPAEVEPEFLHYSYMATKIYNLMAVICIKQEVLWKAKLMIDAARSPWFVKKYRPDLTLSTKDLSKEVESHPKMKPFLEWYENKKYDN